MRFLESIVEMAYNKNDEREDLSQKRKFSNHSIIFFVVDLFVIISIYLLVLIFYALCGHHVTLIPLSIRRDWVWIFIWFIILRVWRLLRK
jgi:hypothetical protein